MRNNVLPCNWSAYHGNVRIYGIGTAHDERLAGLQAKLAQLVVIALAVLAQQQHGAVNVVAQPMASLSAKGNKVKTDGEKSACMTPYHMEARH